MQKLINKSGILLFLMLFFVQNTFARMDAINLMTYQGWGYTVDNTPQGQRVKALLEHIKKTGFTTVVFNFRGYMTGGRSSDIRDAVPLTEQETQERLLKETVQFAQSIGLRVMFRPIVLVVGPKGEFPYVQGSTVWWHGVIKPDNLATWFQALQNFHSRYVRIAQELNVESYSIGAEMHSTLTGLGSRSADWQLGDPEKWLQFLRWVRSGIGQNVKITYAFNYTDQYVKENGVRTYGGEFEQFRHYVSMVTTNPQLKKYQQTLKDFWNELDFVELDYYRSLGADGINYSKKFEELSMQLSTKTYSHAQQVDVTLKIFETLGMKKQLVTFGEVGYRNIEKTFLDPSAYESTGGLFNPIHQAASWQAFFNGFQRPNWSWYDGVHLWCVLVDRDYLSPQDKGFNPFGNQLSTQVFQNAFSQ